MGTRPYEPQTNLSLNLTGLDGQTVVEFLSKFFRQHSEIESVRFESYKPEPKFSERLRNVLTPEEAMLRDEAVKICHGTGIPFWDALLGICMKRDSIPERILETAIAHSATPSPQIFDLLPDEVSSDRITKMIDELSDNYGLVISSKLRLKSGNTAHIPMLDFRCPCSPANNRAIVKILKLLGQNCGIIAESGRSYHYYGATLFSPSEWFKFMARALLFAPIVDPRYIAHRVADGECRLKIVASRNGDIPKIINAYTISN
jgi:hypothetical protein